MINGKKFFNQSIKNDQTYDHVRNIAPGQGDDYTACYLLDNVYFKNYCKMISVDLSNREH